MRRQLARSRRLVSGLVVVGVVGIAAAVAGGDPFAPSATVLEAPSSAHPFGTDELGRDILTRVLHGGGTALKVALLPAVGAGAIGALIGLVAGYFGGLLDEALLRLIELTLVVPRFVLALVTAALFGGRLWLVGAVLAATFWPTTARLVRAEVISLRARPFVEATRSLGAGDARILWRHLLPLVVPIIVVTSSFQAGQAALIEAGLAFLGLGDRNVVSWGAMVADAQSYLALAWWTSVFPGLALGALILALNVLGDGLADAWNVRGADRT